MAWNATVVQLTTDAPLEALRQLPEVERVELHEHGSAGEFANLEFLSRAARA